MYDLHFHTDLSDGINTSHQVVQQAVDKGVQLLACTEHDIVNREVPTLVRSLRARTGGLLHMDTVEGVEVSVGHRDGSYKNSLHITTYSSQLPKGLDDFLEGVRSGKAQKIILQCRTLESHGFQMLDVNGDRVPLSLEAILRRFPTKRADSLTSVDLRILIHEVPENYILASGILSTEVTRSNFLKDCLKREGKYAHIISLPQNVGEYEPSLEKLIKELDMRSTIVSLPHANGSFKTIEEMEQRVGLLVDIGLNAIELNRNVPEDWAEAILRVRTRYGLLLTFGSDSHGIGFVDKYHGEFGTLSPFVYDAEYWKDRFLERTSKSLIEA